MADAFAKMMAASQKKAQKAAKEKATRVPCPNCEATFPNAGALTQHCKFKHRAKMDKRKQPKLNFSQSSSSGLPPAPPSSSSAQARARSSSSSAAASRPPATPPRPKKRRKKPKTPSPKKAKTRSRFSNEKKYVLILAYEEEKRKDPLNFVVNFEQHHPTVSNATMKRWRHPKTREQIKADALSPNPKIREAYVSGDSLKRYLQGAFPEEEDKLYDMFGNRRADGKRVSGRWLKAKMRRLVKDRTEKERARVCHSDAEKLARQKLLEKADKFQGTQGWFRKWKARYQVSLRKRTNSKTKSAQERLPKVQKFHRTAKRFCQPPPQQDEKYGRFAARNRFHVDQVPLEFGGSDTTYEKKGAKVVAIKRSKVDMERRVASLELCFCAAGPQRVKPGICFRATPFVTPTGRVNPSRPQHVLLKRDAKKFPNNVDVYHQKKAWFDTQTSLQFTKNFKNQARPSSQEKLLGLDNLNSQCAPGFIEAMRKAKAQLLYTPADCTDLCAVTDMVRTFGIYSKYPIRGNKLRQVAATLRIMADSEV